MSRPDDRVPLDRFPRSLWITAILLVLTVLYAVLQVGGVRPYLFPAGHGAWIEGEVASAAPFVARPPDLRAQVTPGTVARVAPSSPADRAGVRAGDRIVAEVGGDGDQIIFTFPFTIEGWRAAYWLGVRGPIVLVRGDGERVPLARPAVWRSDADGWARRHLGMILQIVVFTAAAIVLMLLRSSDLTALLSVLALALSAVAGGGPLAGVEGALPLGRVLTVFTWMAGPLAFPIIALAILHFPSPSPLLKQYRWLPVVPLAAAAPMIVLSACSSLYLVGVDGLAGAARWDAVHPAMYYTSFAVALAINVLAIVEGIYRYRYNHDANERRRIRMAVYTAVPGVLAYAVKEGIPIVSRLAGFDGLTYPDGVAAVLQAGVLLPAFGLTYAVGVKRVLGPRVVLRRSIQYALARRTLTIIAVLPAAALVLSLIHDSNRTLAQIVTSGSVVYIVLFAATVAGIRYRDRARQWLDQRFFREEYDARKILVSLASRVRFETDPADLASLVVHQLDEALHPEMAAILVSGIEPGVLTPVAVLHGSAGPLPLDGGLVTMLRWSEEPLEVFPQDLRSPARRLPASELEWLVTSGVVLLVPVMDQARALVGVIALGGKRSEELYSDEDRQLLASVAAQMGLGFDVARLRQRAAEAADETVLVAPAAPPMHECPHCGRCEDETVATCPADGTPLQPARSVPRVLENKYRIEQLLGRGGMGAVYRARDMRLDRLVAVKVVRAELLGDPEARRRFRREAQIVARLQHPSIVSVFDYGTLLDGGAYLVMELVRGEDLRRVLQREGRLSGDTTVRILSAVCAAIDAAHLEGVLHRDLKPENILLPGGGIDAKVLDFGVAKLLVDEPQNATEHSGGTTLTMAGAIVGTPAYMAPEQLRGNQPDARTDVFALGVIAWEMLTGELPFGRASLAEVVLAQARGEPEAVPGAISPPLERAVKIALEMDPERRPSTPGVFATLLRSAISGEG